MLIKLLETWGAASDSPQPGCTGEEQPAYYLPLLENMHTNSRGCELAVSLTIRITFQHLCTEGPYFVQNIELL